jgi:hypothetical protein
MSRRSNDVELARFLVQKQNQAFDAYRNYERLLEDKYGPMYMELATPRERAELDVLLDRVDLALMAATRLVKRVGPEAFVSITGGYLKNCSGRLKLVKVTRSKKPLKKWDAVFQMPNCRTKTVSFGAYRSPGVPYEDYTMHHDKERRRRYIERHSRRESFRDPTKPGTLSRYILWEEPTVRSGVAKYKRRFNL